MSSLREKERDTLLRILHVIRRIEESEPAKDNLMSLWHNRRLDHLRRFHRYYAPHYSLPSVEDICAMEERRRRRRCFPEATGKTEFCPGVFLDNIIDLPEEIDWTGAEQDLRPLEN